MGIIILFNCNYNWRKQCPN